VPKVSPEGSEGSSPTKS